MTKHFTRRVVAGAATAAIAASLVATGGGAAFADTAFGTSDQTAAQATTNLLTTYGVRAGSAGGDYLGITNTNYDFTAGSASATTQYTGYTSKGVDDDSYLGISIWGTSVNESPNPYYWNHIYNRMTDSAATQATTWMSNPGTSSWGDSNDYVGSTGSKAGMEFGGPDIVFGAGKTTSWNDSVQKSTNFYEYDQDSTSYPNFNPSYVNNDATNIWTQVYTEGQLATKADSLAASSGKDVRYGSATESALSYEKAIRGNMLYVASKIYNGTAKKKVAYLYAIDKSGTAYFFTPTADGLLKGDDTGKAATNTESNADSNYAANNSTINMGYMGTLPFITDTFTGEGIEGCEATSLTMKVEDIYKSSPVVKVTNPEALNGVDVIIYNTNSALTSAGTSAGKNTNGIVNKEELTDSVVTAWLPNNNSYGITLIAGDDYGTSTKQGTQADQAPLLYCQRNYTMDKNARAAWAFAKVYPELYGDNGDATYGYWVNKVYHVKTAYVPAVVAKMTKQGSSAVKYTATTANDVEKYAEIGYKWWNDYGIKDSGWSSYSYYTGSSRASYYGTSNSVEADAEIGIFAPSDLWENATHSSTAAESSQQVLMASSAADVSPSISLDVANADQVKVGAYSGCTLYKEELNDGKIKIILKAPTKAEKNDLDDYSIPGIFRYTSRFTDVTVADVSVIEFDGSIVGFAPCTMPMNVASAYTSLKTIIFDKDIASLKAISDDNDYPIIKFYGLDDTHAAPQIVFEGVDDGTSALTRLGSNAFYAAGTVTSENIPEIKVPAAAEVAGDFFRTSNSDLTIQATKVGKTVEEQIADAVESAKSEQKTADDAAQLAAIQKISPSATTLDELVTTVKAEQQAADKASVVTLKTQSVTVTTSKTYKAKKVKKKAQSFKIASAKGKLTVKKVKGSKKLTVKNGKITVKKGTKKGVYTMKVSVSASATSEYAAAATTATITVVVK